MTKVRGRKALGVPKEIRAQISGKKAEISGRGLQIADGSVAEAEGAGE
jgi:hypothetical protein